MMDRRRNPGAAVALALSCRDFGMALAVDGKVVGSAAVDIAVVEHADCSEPCPDIECGQGSQGQ